MVSYDWRIEDNSETGEARRKYARKPTCISASITDIKTGHTLPCIIRDVNPEGCRIKSEHLGDFGKNVSLFPQGFSAAMPGLMVWRQGNAAGIKFSLPNPKNRNVWLKVIQRLQKTNHQPHPRYYELWFSYASNTNQALNRAMDNATRDDGCIPEGAMDEIYDRFLSPMRMVSQIENVNSKVADEFTFLEMALGKASESTQQYGSLLASADMQLGNDQTGETVRAVVARLREATREMELKSRGLEEKLSSSREQIDALTHTLEVVRTESLTDDLTTIANRKRFNDVLESSIQSSKESKEPLALLFGDIDHFKRFNDTFGHQIGDYVLQLVAQSLATNVKKRDLPARYGGEEFAVIMPQTEIQAAINVANHIREAIMNRELTKKSSGENLGKITMSFGVASYRPDEDAREFIARADAALYAAKKGGRNQVKSEIEIASQEDAQVA